MAAPMQAPMVTTAEPVYMTAPAVEEVAPVGTMSEPVPVSTNMMPPRPVATQREVVTGNVTQQRVEAMVTRDEARITVTQHNPTTMATKELGQAVYVTGPTTEQDAPPQIMEMRQEQDAPPQIMEM